MHDMCYRGVVLQTHSLNGITDDATGAELRVCTVKCHKMVLSIQTGSKRFLWEKDGANGTTNENNSITILIHWMTKEGNFARF
jgi:NAD-dependent dihydropyrimidine dehydrogenase PreA subunit